MEELSQERCRQLLDEEAVGHLGVVTDGDPYVSPISYVVVEGRICFRTASGQRMNALREHPRVCVEVSRFDLGSGDWESVIVWGDAVEVEEDDLAQRIVSALLSKYKDVIGSPLSPGSGGFGVTQAGILMAVPIDVMTGRSSGSFFHIRTRPGRL